MNVIFKGFLPFACSTFLCAACALSEGESIVARVDSRPISVADFQSRLSEYRAGPERPMVPSPSDALLKKRVLNELIEESVLLTEAGKMKLEVSPMEFDAAIKRIEQDYPGDSFDEMLAQRRISRARFRERMRLKLLLEKVVTKVTEGVSKPATGEISRYYQDHLQEFKKAEEVQLRQIVVKDKEDGEKLLTDLRKGASFEGMARNHSFAPEASRGGDLGLIPVETLPEPLQKEIARLKAGDLSGVVQSDYGYHILLVANRRPAHQQTLEEASPQIVSILTQKEREERFSAWRRDVLSKVKIERNHGLLSKLP